MHGSSLSPVLISYPKPLPTFRAKRRSAKLVPGPFRAVQLFSLCFVLFLFFFTLILLNKIVCSLGCQSTW